MIFAEDLSPAEYRQLAADLKMLIETAGIEDVPQQLERSVRQRKIDQLRADGICTRCGHVKAYPGRAMCKQCLEKQRKSAAKRQSEKTSKKRKTKAPVFSVSDVVRLASERHISYGEMSRILEEDRNGR